MSSPTARLYPFSRFSGRGLADLRFVPLLLVVTLSTAARAQPQAGSEGDSLRRAEVHEQGLSTVDTPGLDSEVTGSTGSVNLEAARDKESVSVVLTRAFSSSSPDRQQFLGKLSLKGPIGKDAVEADLVTLDGLENFVTASLGITYSRWPYSPTTAIHNARSELCTEYAEVNGLSYDPETHNCTEQYFDPQKPRGAELRDRFELLSWGTKSIRLLGAEASYGQAGFKYLDPESLEKAETTEYGNSVRLYVGLLKLRPSRGGLTRSDILVFAGYRREESYVAGEKTEFCTPLGDAGAERCDSVVLGAPSRKEKDLAFLELRRFFFGQLPIGVSPRLVYDFEEEVTAVELPVYFLTEAAGGLIGGVKVVWNSDSDEVSLGAFVGKKLDFSIR